MRCSAVLGNPGDSRSGMVFVQLYISWKLLAKSVEVPLAFASKLLATLSRGTNRGLTPARTCQDRRKLFVPAVAGRDMLGVPYTNRP